MKIANLVPPPWTGLYPQGTYLMVLAHWVLKYPTYTEQLRNRPRGAYLLMDSGTFEHAQVNVSEMNKAAAAVNADEIVLPDAAGEPQETLQGSWDALGSISTKRVMFVPQGRTNEQWCECLQHWLQEWKEHSWGDNYHLSIGVASLRHPNSTKSLVGSKPYLLKEALKTGLPLHLLGLPDLKNFTKGKGLLQQAFAAGVRGIDTSTAFAMGAKGILVTPDAKKVFLEDPEKYKRLGTWARRLIALNIRILDMWVSAGEASDEIPVIWIRQTASKWLKYWAEGFTDPLAVMEACGMPAGKYAFLKWAGREKYVRPLGKSRDLKEGERIVEVRNVKR